MTKQSIVIEGDKIVSIQNGFIPGDTVIDLSNSWIMPGLIDMHTHVTAVLDPNQPFDSQMVRAYTARPAQMVLSMLPRVKTLLMNGFTTIRNVGDPSSTTYDLRDAINTGIVPGPRMFAVEPQVCVECSDFAASRWGLRRELEKYVTDRGSCSGVVECIKVVRDEVNRGADVIKFRQDELSFDDPKVVMTESKDEIKAIIDTAHQLDKTVAVHITPGNTTFLHEVIEAGADTIEHGPLDDAAIALMQQHGTAYTPTLLAAKIYTEEMNEAGDTRDIYQSALASAGKAYRAGVMIIYGTDLGIFGPERSHEEFGLLHDAGLPNEQVLRAATINAAIKLGRGDTLGSIAPGKIADVIALKADPIAEIKNIKNVSFVMKGGVVCKNER